MAKTFTPRKLTTIEADFLRMWRVLGNGHEFVSQLRFALDIGRQWRFDFSVPSIRLGIELDGGVFMRNRNKGHASPKEYLANIEKQNAAVERGWAVLRFTVKDFEKHRVEETAALVRRVLAARMR